MATKVVMPKMGYDMEEGKIVRWLRTKAPRHRTRISRRSRRRRSTSPFRRWRWGPPKTSRQGGRDGARQEMIAVVAPTSRLTWRCASDGREGEIAEDTVSAGEGREAVPEVASGAQALAVSSTLKLMPRKRPGHRRHSTGTLSRRSAACRRKGVDLRQAGRPGGRITRDDVLRSAERPPPEARRPEKPVQPAAQAAPEGLAPMRQAIARRMARASEAPTSTSPSPSR